MDELDTLFNLDSSLDVLDKTVHEKSVMARRLNQHQLTAHQEASRQHTGTGARGSAEEDSGSRRAPEPSNRELTAEAKGRPAPKPRLSHLLQQRYSFCKQSAGGKAPTDNGHPGYATRNTRVDTDLTIAERPHSAHSRASVRV